MAAPDGMGPMGGFGLDGGQMMGGPGFQGQHGPPMGMGMGPGMDMGMQLERVFPCVRLRGLPFDVTEDEVRVFLGCEPVDILMVKRDGRFSGEAFVVLGSTLQIQMAVDKNKSYMGRRYVEVFRAKKLDYYKAVVQEMMDGTPMHSGGMGGPGMRGGPGSGRMGGMGGMGGAPGPGMMMGGPGGHHGGDFGGGHMQPPPPARGPMQGGRSNGYGEGIGGPGPEPSNVLRLRGLPFSVQKDDIVRWFEDVQITPVTPENVHVITDYGRPTGIALVEFASPGDAQTALSKDKQMMGTRYIEIFPSSRDELSRYLPRSY